MSNNTTIKGFTYTANEMAMLKVFWQTSVDICGRCSDEENLSYCNAKDLQDELGGSLQSIGGTMASLQTKCAIYDNGDSARGCHINDFILGCGQIMDHFNAIDSEEGAYKEEGERK